MCVGGALFCAMNPVSQIIAAGVQSESCITIGSINLTIRSK
jgi:hypothetical protein